MRRLLTGLLLVVATHVWAVTPDAITPDGGRYYGPLVNSRMQGSGRLEGDSGVVYEGEFREGMMWGKGRFTDPQGNVYEGDFDKGKLTGTGRFTAKSGERYEGGFKDWVYHGRGVLRLPNGEVYEGEFVDGLYQGKKGTAPTSPPNYGPSVELALYTQKDLLQKSLAALQPREPGKINLWLVAVAGDGTQEVFRREV